MYSRTPPTPPPDTPPIMSYECIRNIKYTLFITDETQRTDIKNALLCSLTVLNLIQLVFIPQLKFRLFEKASFSNQQRCNHFNFTQDGERL